MANNKNFIAKNGVSTGDGYAIPDIYPSLSFNCVNSKALDPRITFTRGSTATYWDGHTTTKAEENLSLYSQSISNLTQNNTTVVDNNTTAPDGTTTASKATVNTDTSQFHDAYTNSLTVTSGITYTHSVYVKAGTGVSAVYFYSTIGGGSGRIAKFNISTGAYIGNASGDGYAAFDSYSITDVGNSWYRIQATQTATSSTTRPFTLGLSNTTTDDVQAYNGNGTDHCFVWGRQIEERSSATAYIATTTSVVIKYQPTLQTAASGVARFDHYPVTGESRGLMLEPEATNLVNQSEDAPFQFSNIYSQPFLENTAIAPDGTQTADCVYGSRIDPSSRLQRAFSYASGTKLTLSFFQKTMSGSHDSNGSPVWAFQNSVGMTADTVVTEPVGNGWYRMHYVMTTTAASQTLRLYYSSAVGQDDVIAVWGYQIEVGSFPTSYIPTSGSTVTRPRDSASFDSTQTAEVLNVTEGTFFAEAEYDPDEAGGGFGAGIGISTSNYLGIFYSNTSTAYMQPTHASIASGASSPVSGVQKAALTWDGTVVSFPVRYAFNGTVGAEDNGNTTGTISPLVTYDGSVDITLGRARFDSASTYGKNMWLRNFALYPKALGEATLQQMTEE